MSTYLLEIYAICLAMHLALTLNINVMHVYDFPIQNISGFVRAHISTKI